MDSEGILHFSFFFYALMKGRIATISFGCLWINKFKKGGTHMKETKIYADEFCTTFASTTEMLEFLAERAKQSKWIRKPTRMLKLVPLEKEAETIEEACEKELEGIVEDTEKNTQLVLKVNKDFYPVRDCAIHTILKRAGINGTGLKKLEKATYAKVVNYCLQVAKGDALIKVADGKVSAVHGGDDHDYCVLDMQTIFNMTSDYLKAHFKGSTYLEGSGSFDHSIVSAMWTLGGNQELLDTYHQALEDHGIEDKSLAPALRLTTSDGNVLRNEDEIELTVEEMENTPYPAYELLPSSNPYTQLPVETSRGCRFSCAFCSIPHRRNWRGLSVEHVIKRVKHALQFKDNINRGTRLLFVDDCFTANGERAINVFKKLHRLYGYTEKVFIEARVTDILKNQILQNIPLQMVSSMQIGVECGYNEGLKKIRKGLTVEQLFSALEILKQYQFDKHCFLSFIIGFPWETMEMINKTLDTIELICTKYKIVCNLNWLLLLPSDLWWEKEDFNIHIEEDMFDNLLWYANSDYFFTTHPLISMEDIIQVEKRIGAMQRQGGTVAYRRRIGNEEDYIEPSACSE